MDPREDKGKATEDMEEETGRRCASRATLDRALGAFDPIDDLLQDLEDSPPQMPEADPSHLDSRAVSIVQQMALSTAIAYFASRSRSQNQWNQSCPYPTDDDDDFPVGDMTHGSSDKAKGKLPERSGTPIPRDHDRRLPRKPVGSGMGEAAAARHHEREASNSDRSSRNDNNGNGADHSPLLSFAQRVGLPPGRARLLPNPPPTTSWASSLPPSPPLPDSPPLPPSPPPPSPPPHTIRPEPPHQQRPSLLTPSDLPTQTYAAIILSPDFDLYLDYPARIHHLRHPGEASGAASMGWEDLHLRQRVSCPRIHARWARPMTAADRARMAHFLRFCDDGPHAAAPSPSSRAHHNSSPFPSPSPPLTPGPTVLGLRPYRDILHLDTSYLATFLSRRAVARRLLAPFDPAAELLPFIAAGDRAKVTTLAISSGALHSQPQHHDDGAAAATTTLGLLCEILAAALPRLRRLLLVTTAVVDRPASAAWDLETEFARWVRLADVVALEATATRAAAAAAAAAGAASSSPSSRAVPIEDKDEGPIARHAQETSLLPGAVESAYATALHTTLPARAVRLAAIQSKTSASRIARPKQTPKAEVEARRGGQMTTVPSPSPITEDEAQSVVSDLSSNTGPTVCGGGRGEKDEMSGSDGPRPLKVEPFVLLYYRDAFERAVAQGWKQDELLPVDHINLRLE